MRLQLLFQLFARARVSDLRYLRRFIVDLEGDDGYLEAHTFEHKGRRVQRTQRYAAFESSSEGSE